jgi:hypothetical protein
VTLRGRLGTWEEQFLESYVAWRRQNPIKEERLGVAEGGNPLVLRGVAATFLLFGRL